MMPSIVWMLRKLVSTIKKRDKKEERSREEGEHR